MGSTTKAVAEYYAETREQVSDKLHLQLQVKLPVLCFISGFIYAYLLLIPVTEAFSASISLTWSLLFQN